MPRTKTLNVPFPSSPEEQQQNDVVDDGSEEEEEQVLETEEEEEGDGTNVENEQAQEEEVDENREGEVRDYESAEEGDEDDETMKNSPSKPQSAEEESGDEDESEENKQEGDANDTRSEPEHHYANVANNKPSCVLAIAAPPTESAMDVTAKKRPLETTDDDFEMQMNQRTMKKEEENTGKKNGNDGQVSKFQKKFSDEDEIVILKGLIAKGHNWSTNLTGFTDFIKDSLGMVNVSKDQMCSKVRRLKDKYRNNAKRVRPGKDLLFSNTHDRDLYQLSKQIWGKDVGVAINNVGRNLASGNVATKSKSQRNGNSVAPATVEPKSEDDRTNSMYTYLNVSLQSQDNLTMLPQVLRETVSKNGWDFIGSSNAKKLDQRWKNMVIAESKNYLERLELVRDQAKLMLEVLKSSNL